MSAAQYARLVPKKYRSKTLPKIDRPWRPRVIAWAGPAAFYPNRFYEVDKWYKARIDKPEKLPEMHIIEPAEHMKSLKVLMQKCEGKIREKLKKIPEKNIFFSWNRANQYWIQTAWGGGKSWKIGRRSYRIGEKITTYAM